MPRPVWPLGLSRPVRVPHIGQVYAQGGFAVPGRRGGETAGEPRNGVPEPGPKKSESGLDKAGGVRKIVPAGGGPLRRTGAGCSSKEAFGGSGAHNSGKHAGAAVNEKPAQGRRDLIAWRAIFWRRVARFDNAAVPVGHVSVFRQGE